MTSDVITQAASTAIKNAAAQTGTDLPTQSRSLQTADFERLMSQAQEQHAHVQLTNPKGELGQQGVRRLTTEMGESSQRCVTTLEASKQGMATLDFNDPASMAKTFSHLQNAVAATAQFSIMLNQVSAARKSLGELFKSQG
jgi:hypothetical protein